MVEVPDDMLPNKILAPDEDRSYIETAEREFSFESGCCKTDDTRISNDTTSKTVGGRESPAMEQGIAPQPHLHYSHLVVDGWPTLRRIWLRFRFLGLVLVASSSSGAGCTVPAMVVGCRLNECEGACRKF
jgi:hypothetical protein